MPGTAIVQSGNYVLEIDAGFNIDGFKLDDPVQGILAGYTTTTTRTNLVANPNFETNTTGWSAFGALITLSRITTDSYVGTGAAQVVRASNSGGAANQGIDATIATYIPIVAGQTYRLSAYLKLVSGLPNCFVTIAWMNASNVYLSENGSTVTALTSSWQRLSVSATAPANAAYARILVRENISASEAAATWLIDALLLETGSTLLPYFDGTYADTYSGYTLTSQAWNGTADASTSTATWGLNSSYINSTYVLDGTTPYADVTDGTLNIAVRRGRKDQGDQFSAGTMTFTLNDTLAAGIFNPFDTSSPFYDANANVPGLAPMRRVRLGRYDASNTLEYLFKGYVVNYDYNFALGGLNTVSVYCADDFYLLAQTYMDAYNVSTETSGQRIESVLNLPEVDYPTGPTARNISTGTVNLGHDTAYTVPAGTNVLAYLNQINGTAEFGRLFVSRDGVLTFQNRIGATLSGSVADFKDNGTGVKYDNVGITFEADSVVNRAYVQNLGGSNATASDTASIATYFIQTESITNSLLETSGSQLSAAATYLLNGEPEARYTDVATKFVMLTSAQRDTVATIDIGDTITIEKTFQTGTGTTSLGQELSIEGIEHMIDFNTGHRINLYTAATTIVYQLILDDPTYGVLDALNVLG
jgi:hypothetical protein